MLFGELMSKYNFRVNIGKYTELQVAITQTYV